jgi:hypothetical protein
MAIVGKNLWEKMTLAPLEKPYLLGSGILGDFWGKLGRG